MLLRHTTLIRNLSAIMRQGCSARSPKAGLKGRLVARSLQELVGGHARCRAPRGTYRSRRDRGNRCTPRSWLRRSRKGLWYCTQDIPADRIRRLFGFVELARVAG